MNDHFVGLKHENLHQMQHLYGKTTETKPLSDYELVTSTIHLHSATYCSGVCIVGGFNGIKYATNVKHKVLYSDFKWNGEQVISSQK